jgi:hypothetical protein
MISKSTREYFFHKFHCEEPKLLPFLTNNLSFLDTFVYFDGIPESKVMFIDDEDMHTSDKKA